MFLIRFTDSHCITEYTGFICCEFCVDFCYNKCYGLPQHIRKEHRCEGRVVNMILEKEMSNYRRTAKCLSQQLRRLKQTQERKEEQRKWNTKRQRQLRLAQSQKRRKQIIELDAAQHRDARPQLSQEQRGLLQVPVDVARHSSGLVEVRCYNCNALMFIGERTGGTVNNPSFGICSKSGMIKIENIPEFFKANIQQLNNDQRIISENIQQKIDRSEGGLIFIDDPEDINDKTLMEAEYGKRIKYFPHEREMDSSNDEYANRNIIAHGHTPKHCKNAQIAAAAANDTNKTRFSNCMNNYKNNSDILGK
ncbi:Hypothetical predicted protein [Octopus vulgaris]|uniref:Uncharacterized protein n=1 Tax=Octopus vulgaris TaxID=6645 RepID=A0AA36AJW2_OCTVU|nr:Hypothetical predicted protein [Octopus vulgaris]